MIYLLPIGQVISFISVVYAVLIVLAIPISWKFGGHSQTVWGSIGFAFSGATVLQLVLMVCFNFGWRRLWKWIPALNRMLFPDIGGEWKIEINWHGEGKDGGVVNAEATIRQDFLRVSMEVRSPKSDSQTLIAQPKKDPESGRPVLYYVYHVTPKAMGANSSPQYHGAAILKFWEADGGQLRGNYWTSQRTSGHFLLRRT
jgi:hypothetical protein